jgi:hypothetical protein
VDARATENRWRGTGFGQVVESAPGDRRRWWHVDARDVSNAHRDLTVLVNRDKVVLVGPPDRTAELSARGAGQLSMALRDAAAQARK